MLSLVLISPVLLLQACTDSVCQFILCDHGTAHPVYDVQREGDIRRPRTEGSDGVHARQNLGSKFVS